MANKKRTPAVEWTKWYEEPALKLSAANYEATLLPDMGANVIELRDIDRGLDLLRVPADYETFKRSSMVYGIPVLFPPNRIEDGTFKVGEKVYQFRINNAKSNNHIHGFLYSIPWEITKTETTDNEAVVEATFNADSSTAFYNEFPHEFQIKLKYTLCESGLEQKVYIINKSSEPMPMGLGFHTAFKLPFHSAGKEEDCTFRVSIGDRWELTERCLPNGKLIPAGYKEKAYREEGISTLGVCVDAHYTSKPFMFKGREFTGAIIEDRSLRLAVIYSAGKEYKHWMLWNGKGGQGFICPEPQTWAINAPNIKLPAELTGFKLLYPDEVWEGWSNIAVEEI